MAPVNKTTVPPLLSLLLTEFLSFVPSHIKLTSARINSWHVPMQVTAGCLRLPKGQLPSNVKWH